MIELCPMFSCLHHSRRALFWTVVNEFIAFESRAEKWNYYIYKHKFSYPMFILLSRHNMAAKVCRWDGGVIVAQAYRALRGNIPISQTFTAGVLVYQYSSGAGRRTAVFRSQCSMENPRPAYPRQPPSHGANTVGNPIQFCGYKVNIHKSENVTLQESLFKSI